MRELPKKEPSVMLAGLEVEETELDAGMARQDGSVLSCWSCCKSLLSMTADKRIFGAVLPLAAL